MSQQAGQKIVENVAQSQSGESSAGFTLNVEHMTSGLAPGNVELSSHSLHDYTLLDEMCAPWTHNSSDMTWFSLFPFLGNLENATQ